MEIIEISSVQNDLVKFCVKLQDAKFRKEQKLILIDGQKTIDGLIYDNCIFEYFFCLKDNPIAKKVKTKKLIYVNEAILKKVSTTKTPTEIVGIIKEPNIDKTSFLKLSKIALIENIKDAGNLGTIIRSANAFSIDGIVLFGDCVDLYNSKTIRATAQNMFKIPILKINDIEFIKELKKTHCFISTVVDSPDVICDFSLKENFIIAFGSESCGLTQEIVAMSDKKVTLRMDNNVESLNLGVCASIIFALIRYSK